MAVYVQPNDLDAFSAVTPSAAGQPLASMFGISIKVFLSVLFSVRNAKYLGKAEYVSERDKNPGVVMSRDIMAKSAYRIQLLQSRLFALCAILTLLLEDSANILNGDMSVCVISKRPIECRVCLQQDNNMLIDGKDAWALHMMDVHCGNQKVYGAICHKANTGPMGSRSMALVNGDHQRTNKRCRKGKELNNVPSKKRRCSNAIAAGPAISKSIMGKDIAVDPECDSEQDSDSERSFESKWQEGVVDPHANEKFWVAGWD